MLAILVNPVAGVGGLAGLAGSDGAPVQQAAWSRGGIPQGEQRATMALHAALALYPKFAEQALLTASGMMGADMIRSMGLHPTVVYQAAAVHTTAADTTAAVRACLAAGATLVVFAGGDGTARDIAAGLEFAEHVSMLGIPAGVKMYSSVFALTPRTAGSMMASWATALDQQRVLPTQTQEIVDCDEAALREARARPQLYATARVPFLPGRTQARKAATAAHDDASVRAAARGAMAQMHPGVRYLVGPGSTMVELARLLGVAKSSWGVDVILDGEIIRARASARELMHEVSQGPSRAILTAIGGQGFVVGRGNQQLSAAVIRRLGKDPLMLVAPESKLIGLSGRPLLLDTGDADLDSQLSGYIPVITGIQTTSIYPVRAASAIDY